MYRAPCSAGRKGDDCRGEIGRDGCCLFTRRQAWLLAALLGIFVGVLLLFSTPARAEYRAYEHEIIDLVECRLKKQKPCKTARVLTSMPADLYERTHGGADRIAVLMIATWMCHGDTSNFRQVCSRPPARKPRFKAGEDVVITLGKHITNGWRGKVEVAYYQASLRSNIYGVRFAERSNIYARYFEKDLAKPGSKEAEAVTGPAPAAAATAETVPEAVPEAASPEAATQAAPAAETPAAETPAAETTEQTAPPAPEAAAQPQQAPPQ